MTELTDRERRILDAALAKRKAQKSFAVPTVQLSLGEVVKAIWPDGEAPKSSSQTASWTMRNLSQKMMRVGETFKNERTRGRGKVASYEFSAGALATARTLNL